MEDKTTKEDPKDTTEDKGTKVEADGIMGEREAVTKTTCTMDEADIKIIAEG